MTEDGEGEVSVNQSPETAFRACVGAWDVCISVCACHSTLAKEHLPISPKNISLNHVQLCESVDEKSVQILHSCKTILQALYACITYIFIPIIYYITSCCDANNSRRRNKLYPGHRQRMNRIVAIRPFFPISGAPAS